MAPDRHRGPQGTAGTAITGTTIAVPLSVPMLVLARSLLLAAVLTLPLFLALSLLLGLVLSRSLLLLLVLLLSLTLVLIEVLSLSLAPSLHQ